MGGFPRGARGFARVDPRNPVAYAICDRCGQRYNRTDLTWQFEWQGVQLQNQRILVCRRKCLDVANEQLRAYAVPPDPVPVLNARPDLSEMYSSFTPYLTDEFGNLITDEFGHPIVISQGPAYYSDFVSMDGPLKVINIYAWPQLPNNLPPGYVWRDANNIAHVVPGIVPVPTQPLFLNVASAAQMLLNGAGNVPLRDPLVFNQIWNNQGILWVSGGPGPAPPPPSPPDFADIGGVLQILNATGWPLSSAGLVAGQVWDANGAVFVIPGVVPNPSATPLFFGTVTSPLLLALGGGNLPLIDPVVVNQLWNNAGIVCVSLGPTPDFANIGGVLQILNATGWPMSDPGVPGAVWDASGAVYVVPGVTPNPAAPPVFFGAVTSAQLLALGGGNLPLIDPAILNQLWNNAGIVCVSIGPTPDFANISGVLQILNSTGWPMSDPGTPGAVWDSSGAVYVVPGITPNPAAPPVFFGVITSAGLLALGGGNLPLTDPRALNQLWNNAGIVCVSLGI